MNGCPALYLCAGSRGEMELSLPLSARDEEPSPRSQMTALCWLSFWPRHLLLLSVPWPSFKTKTGAVVPAEMSVTFQTGAIHKRHSAITHDISVLLVQARLVQKSYETVQKSFCLHIPSFFPLWSKLNLGFPSNYQVSRSQWSPGIFLTVLWQLPRPTVHRLGH